MLWNTLSKKAIWINLIALIAAVGTAFGLDLGLDAQTQAEIVAGILALVNVVMHGTQHKRDKDRDRSSNGGGSINTSLVLLPLVALTCFALAACASLPAPSTPRQSLAYAESSYTAVVKTATDLYTQGMLSEQQETHVDALIRSGNVDLNLAHAALAQNDMSTMQSKLSALDQVLNQLRVIVRAEVANHE